MAALLLGCSVITIGNSAKAEDVTVHEIITGEDQEISHTIYENKHYKYNQGGNNDDDGWGWDVQGGAIKNKSSDLNIEAVYFNNNSITAPSDYDYQSANGGAFANVAGASIKTMEHTNFVNNNAYNSGDNNNGNGGALYNAGAADDKHAGIISRMAYNDFYNNKAGYSGGAIYNCGVIGSLIQSKFYFNEAMTGGGLSNSNGATISIIDNSEFTSNKATNNPWSTGGGGIYNAGIIGEILNTNFDSNISAAGGGIYNDTGSNIAKIESTDGDKFIKNTVTGTAFSPGGGAIYNRGTIGTIKGYSFEENTATFSGGAIYNAAGYHDDHSGTDIPEGEINEITNVKFINNTAKSSGQPLGGAIANSGHIGTITNTEFSGNQAQYGGAIYNNGSIGAIQGATFDNNTTISLGGAIYEDGGNIISITGSNFLNNTSGGAIYLLNSSIDHIVGTTFDNNKTNLYGAAIALRENCSLGEILGSEFKNNTSSGPGGAIYALDNTELSGNVISIGNISHTKFIGNTGKGSVGSTSYPTYGHGGAIYLGAYNSIKNLTDVEFKDNTSGGSGGAIYTNPNSEIGDLTNVKFENNKTTPISSTTSGLVYGVGGTIHNQGTIGNWDGGYIYGAGSSYKVQQGGAIWNNGKMGSIGSSAITDSNSDGKWGFLIKDTYSNSNGGAIYNDTDAKIINEETGDGLYNLKIENSYAGGTGGGLWNNGTVGNLRNVSFNNVGASSFGGAVYNLKTIGDWDGGYIYGLGSDNIMNQGAGIWNSGKMGSIGSSIITNSDSDGEWGFLIKDTYSVQNGGAIYNQTDAKIINEETGDGLYNLKIENSYAGGTGGGIFNLGTIGNMRNVSFDNVGLTNSSGNGGAIHNQGTIGNWDGGYIDGTGTEHIIQQGAGIWNNGNMGNISNFNIKNAYVYRQGGAIFNGDYNNMAEIKNLENITISNSFSGQQGAGIWNTGIIGNLTNVNFENVGLNPTNSSTINQGGVIYNVDGGMIGNWDGGHIYGLGDQEYLAYEGGGIWNNATMGSISNLIIKDCYAEVKAGAIYNNGTINGIKNSTFTNNTSKNLGGAIYNTADGNLNEIVNTSFKNNTAENKGGAIYTESTTLNISANDGQSIFSGNTVGSEDLQVSNAIYMANESTSQINLKSQNKGLVQFDDEIDGVSYSIDINGDNTTSKVQLNNLIHNADGGAVSNNVTLGIGVTDTENAISDVFATTDLNFNSGAIDLIDNKATQYNFKTFKSEGTGTVGLDIVLEDDGHTGHTDTFNIGKGSSGTINVSSVNLNENYDGEYTIQVIFQDDEDNVGLNLLTETKSEAQAHMDSNMVLADDLYTTKTLKDNDSIYIKNGKNTFYEWAKFDSKGKSKSFDFIDSSNYKTNKDITLVGNDITIKGSYNTLDANNKAFLDNIASVQSIKLSDINIINQNDINNDGSLTLNNTKLDVNRISSNDVGKLNLEGKTNLAIDKINKQDIKLNNESTLNINNISTFTNNSIDINDSANVNIADLGLNNLKLNSLALNNGNINIDRVSVDLENRQMGRITADSYTLGNAKINVNDMILTSDAKDKVTPVLFADKEIKNNVTSTVTEVPTTEQGTVYSPIYKYDVNYSTDGTYGEDGYYIFSLHGTDIENGGNNGNGSGGSLGKNPSIDSLNPAVYSSAVAQQVGGYAAVNEAFRYAFQYADHYLLLNHIAREEIKNSNKYAINEYHTPYNDSEADHNDFWFKPYTSFESVPLKKGPKVDLISYGTLVGIDSKENILKRGWSNVNTAYIGYNGSSQSYSGIHTYQNGGLLGATSTFYKNNFFTALTATVGASVGETSNMYGKEDFSMLLSGVASKTGYSYELFNDKLMIQPSLMLAYSFINTFDYTNSAGVRINSDPLHAIQINPNVRFVFNTESRWQPYISAGAIWNIMDKTNVMANEVQLPSLSIKPYAEYGIGIQKQVQDNFTGYAQAMARSGGRRGVALSVGLKWNIGKDDKVEKVQSKNNLAKI